jgi:hypothetical protein
MVENSASARVLPFRTLETRVISVVPILGILMPNMGMFKLEVSPVRDTRSPVQTTPAPQPSGMHTAGLSLMGLHLKGERKAQRSIRINDQWRICFEWEDGGASSVEIVDYHRLSRKRWPN